MKKFISALLALAATLALSSCGGSPTKMEISPASFSQETRDVLTILDDEIAFFDYVVEEPIQSVSYDLWFYEEGQWRSAGKVYSDASPPDRRPGQRFHLRPLRDHKERPHQIQLSQRGRLQRRDHDWAIPPIESHPHYVGEGDPPVAAPRHRSKRPVGGTLGKLPGGGLQCRPGSDRHLLGGSGGLNQQFYPKSPFGRYIHRGIPFPLPLKNFIITKGVDPYEPGFI